MAVGIESAQPVSNAKHFGSIVDEPAEKNTTPGIPLY